MKKSFLLSAFLFSFAINAQTGRVGINTDNPKATLHIEASASDPNVLDGVIPPKLLGDELKLKNYTIDQKGAIVYVTAIPDSLSGQVIEMTSPGFYYFNGLLWKSFNVEDAITTAGTKVGKPLFGQIEYAGGDTVGYENTYGFYSANENKVSGFTIQNDGDIIPMIYVKDKLSDEVINYIEVLSGQINVKSPISMSQSSVITESYQLVPKIWVENLVNSRLTVPAPPTVGSYTLTAVNGVMQWVAN